MKKLSLLTVLMCLCFNLPVAHADITGTVTGRITVMENRFLAFITQVT
jgi:hypothetical protein